MSIWEVTLYSAIRCFLVVVLAIPAGYQISRFMNRVRGKQKYVLWGLICFPLFVPELLAGYSYANFSLNLVNWPWLNEVFYFFLLLIKALPVSVVTFYLSPPSLMSDTAVYCHFLAKQSNALFKSPGILQRFLLICKNCQMQFYFVSAVTFLYAFQEFQVASLLGITYKSHHYPASWTVWIFDANATGMYLSETLSRLVVPVLCEIVIVVPLLFVFLKISRFRVAHSQIRRPESRKVGHWISFYGVISLLFYLLIPLIVIGVEIPTGWNNLFQSSNYFEEVITGFVLSIIVGGITVWCCRRLIRKSRTGHWKLRLIPVVILIMTGLLGSLTLSLVLLWLFQLNPFNSVYDTPVPWFLAMLFYLFPRILILQILFSLREQREPHALMNLLKANDSLTSSKEYLQLKWSLNYRRSFWLVCLAGMWAYWDLTISSILLPPRYSTATVRLYNLMHYGRSETLSAMLLLAIIFPLIMVFIFYLLRKPAIRILSIYE